MNARSRATGVKSAPPAVDMITKAQVTIPQLTNKAEEASQETICLFFIFSSFFLTVLTRKMLLLNVYFFQAK